MTGMSSSVVMRSDSLNSGESSKRPPKDKSRVAPKSASHTSPTNASPEKPTSESARKENRRKEEHRKRCDAALTAFLKQRGYDTNPGYQGGARFEVIEHEGTMCIRDRMTLARPIPIPGLAPFRPAGEAKPTVLINYDHLQLDHYLRTHHAGKNPMIKVRGHDHPRFILGSKNEGDVTYTTIVDQVKCQTVDRWEAGTTPPLE